ncbi:MAG: hypothetical protein IV100_00255 [Myxococcales bacterium]|nr:hypothetical protein [Myxococcales bacterium]
MSLQRAIPAIVVILAALVAQAIEPAGPVPPTTGIPLGSADFDPGPQADRGNDGGYHPRVPLEVLPGRRGLQPTVELVYSHTRANGSLGAGWGLSFESSIERRSEHHGVATLLDCARDTFLLDGQPLVKVALDDYRAVRDPFTVYKPVRFGPAGSSECGEITGWTAIRDGITHVFGSRLGQAPGDGADGVRYRTSAVNILCGGPKEPLCTNASGAVGWHLTRVEDAFGNRMDFAYATYGRLEYPRTITYNDLPSGDRHQVILTWQTRKDDRLTYADGTRRTLDRRLESVEVTSRRGGKTYTFKKYGLFYSVSECNNQSLLTQVVEYELNADLAPSSSSRSVVQFDYNDECATTWDTQKSFKFDPPTQEEDYQIHNTTSVQDVDADGRPDLLILDRSCSPARVVPEKGPDGVPLENGTFSWENLDPGLALPYITPSLCVPRFRVFLNTSSAGNLSLGPMDIDVDRSKAMDEFFGAISFRTGDGSALMHLVDLNGDGYLDLIRGHAPELGQGGQFVLGASQNTAGKGWSAEPTQDQWWLDGPDISDWERPRGPLDVLRFKDFQFADINADGLPDLVSQSEVYFNQGGRDGDFFQRPNPFDSTCMDCRKTIVDPFLSDGIEPPPDQGLGPVAGGGFYPPQAFGTFGEDQDKCGDGSDYQSPGVENVSFGEWVWRHTTHADFNGDGIVDRLVSVPWVHLQTHTFVGGANRLYYGDGTGEFHSADHGVGGGLAAVTAAIGRLRQFPPEGTNQAGCQDRPVYRSQVNHFGLADFNQDGRADVVHRCPPLPTNPMTDLLVLPDRGYGSSDPDAESFGLPEWDSACAAPSGSQAGSVRGIDLQMRWHDMDADPEDDDLRSTPFIGSTPSGTKTSTLTDLDGDGVVDLVVYAADYVTDDEDDPDDDVDDVSPGGDDGVLLWTPGVRAAAHGRLARIIGPRGGVTQLNWTVANASSSRSPSILPVIESVSGPSGTTHYRFEQGNYRNRRFMGFGRVIRSDAAGATSVRTFATSPALEGVELSEATYRQDGRIHALAVSVPGGGSDCGWLPIDTSAPFFNPIVRRCVFDFADGVAGDIDPEDYAQTCRDFTGERVCTKLNPCGQGDEWLSAPNLDAASWAVLAGTDPALLTSATPGGTSYLAFLASASAGTAAVCATSSGALGKPPQPDLPPAPGPDLQLYSPDPQHPTVPLEFSGAQGGNPSNPKPADYVRFLATEWDYNSASGKVSETRELRDVSKRNDTLVITDTYVKGSGSPFVPTDFPWYRLTKREEKNADGDRLSVNEFLNYQKDEWTQQKQQAGSLVRSRTRTLTTEGLVSGETTWSGLEPQGFTYDACGAVSGEANALGHYRLTKRDAICRPTEVRTSAGLLEKTLYDGFSRPIRKTETIPATVSTQQPDVIETRWAYADGPTGVGWNNPAHVEVLPEPDGTETVAKTYVDEFGRPFRWVRCRRDGDNDAWSGSLEVAYGCAASEPAVQRLTGRYQATGEVAWESAWHASTVPLTAFDFSAIQYDDLRRPLVRKQPDGHLRLNAYDVGLTFEWDPLGIEAMRLETTVSTETWLAGRRLRREELDPLRRVVAETDAAGSTKNHSYDGFSRRTSTSYPKVQILASGATQAVEATPRELTFYDLADRPTLRIDPAGSVALTIYDTIGRPVRVFGPDGAAVTSTVYVDGTAPGRRRVYTDDRGNRRTEYVDAKDRVVNERRTDGSQRRYDYDGRGRLAQVTEPWGEQIRTTYDRFGRETTSTRIFGPTNAPVVATTSTERDARGRAIRTVSPDGVVTTQSWDAMDRPVESILGEGAFARLLERSLYDAAGRRTSVVERGRERRYTYDDWGRVTYEELGPGIEPGQAPAMAYWRTWTDTDWLATETNGAGDLTTHSYDPLGRKLSTAFRDADGVDLGTATFGYDAAGRVTSAKDERGLETRTRYDGYGRVVEVRPPGLGAIRTSWVRNPPHPITGAATRALLEQTRAPTGEVTRVYRDGEGREFFRIGPDQVGLETQFKNGRPFRSIRWGADKAVFAVKVRQFVSRTTRLSAERDWVAPNQEAACAKFGTGDTTCPVGAVRWLYDLGGRTTHVTDAAGNITRYEYLPSSGLLSGVELGGLTSLRFGYDTTFPVRTRQEVGPVGAPIVTTTQWDRFVQIARTDTTAAAGTESERVDYGYDAAGRKVAAAFSRSGAPESTTTWVYDGRGRVAEKTLGVGLEESLAMTWDYLPNGLIAGITYPSGRNVDYVYPNSSNVLSAIELADEPSNVVLAEFTNIDTSGRARQIDFLPGPPMAQQISLARKFSWGRESERRIDGISSAGERVESFSYDVAGRLAAINTTEGSGLPTDLVYAYSERDHVTAETRSIETLLETLTATMTYEYDPGGRRVWQEKKTADGQSQSLSYMFGSGNRLLSSSAPGSDAINWDSYGRQRNDQRGQVFEYGLRHHIRRIVPTSGGAITMRFDADGNRISRDDDTGSHLYFTGHIPGQVLHHAGPDDLEEDIVMTPAGTVVAIIDQNDVVRPVVRSLTGSPYQIGTSETDATAREFSAFGEVLAGSGPETELGFQQTWASGAELVQFAGVRAYDPSTGRFLTPDPLLFEASSDPGEAVDLFRYAQNNPVHRSDPTGYRASPVGYAYKQGSMGGPATPSQRWNLSFHEGSKKDKNGKKIVSGAPNGKAPSQPTAASSPSTPEPPPAGSSSSFETETDTGGADMGAGEKKTSKLSWARRLSRSPEQVRDNGRPDYGDSDPNTISDEDEGFGQSAQPQQDFPGDKLEIPHGWIFVDGQWVPEDIYGKDPGWSSNPKAEIFISQETKTPTPDVPGVPVLGASAAVEHKMAYGLNGLTFSTEEKLWAGFVLSDGDGGGAKLGAVVTLDGDGASVGVEGSLAHGPAEIKVSGAVDPITGATTVAGEGTLKAQVVPTVDIGVTGGVSATGSWMTAVETLIAGWMYGSPAY